MLPDAAGFCIDRTDYLHLYNTNADDKVSWVKGHRARAIILSLPTAHHAQYLYSPTPHHKRYEKSIYQRPVVTM